MSDQPIQPKRQGVLHDVALTTALINHMMAGSPLWEEAFDTATSRDEGTIELLSSMAKLAIVFQGEYDELDPEESKEMDWTDLIAKLTRAFPEHYRTGASEADTVRAVLGAKF